VHPLWKPHVTAGSNAFPIQYLSHVTHDKEADEIKKDQSLAFKPKTKVGKLLGKFDGLAPVGETFKPYQDKFEQITHEHAVFPGQITWWGLNTQRLEEGILFKDALDKVVHFEEVATYLKSPADSRYGNNAFTVFFPDLMESYKDSRSDCEVKEVYLKLGGTLRYKHEVCYVIIVVMEDDITELEYFQELPSVYNEPRFIHNNCIDEEGKVLNEETPSFRINHISSNSTWETLAFGFYFPKDSQLSLQCSKDLCTEEKISHTFCTSTKPPPGGGKWVCPNDLASYSAMEYF